MSKYAFVYHGEPQFDSPEAGSEYKAKWQAWAGSIGDAWVDPVIPLMAPKMVSSSGVTDGGGSNRVTGFSIVTADSLDAAVQMAKGCPHLEHGTLEVAEVMDMAM